MPISISCPECNYSYDVANDLAGKTVRCPECQSAISIESQTVDKRLYGVHVILIAAVTGFAAGAATVELLTMSRAAPAGQSQNESKPKWTRSEFEELVIGKTGEQVLQLLGRPEHTSRTPRLESWSYRNIAVDPISGKVGSATLWFDRGSADKVTSINW